MIIRRGALDSQACVPTSWTDQQVKEFVERENPCGTEHGWRVRKEGDPLLTGVSERVNCSERQGFVHIMLDA